jgi:branched-chain amino acid transport system substrate-binding protein
MRKRLTAVCLAALGAILVGVAGAAPEATPGVTSSQILLGGSVPLSGEAAAGGKVALGAEAYFKYVNAKGGVFGRKIVFKFLDDGYDPSRAIQNVRQLVQQDHVFAMFSTLGTANNLAIRNAITPLKVPQLYVAAGATTFGRDYTRYPWTIGYIPTYQGEGKIYGRYLARTKPRARIGVLYQDDEYGRDLLGGLGEGLGGKRGNLVAKIGYDPTASDVQSQIAQLKAARVDVLCVFAFGKFALQAYGFAAKLGWKPQFVVNDVAAASVLMKLVPQKTAERSISIVFGKDPAAPQWAKDPGVKLFRTILKRFGPKSSVDLQDGYLLAGMGAAYTMVDTLKKAGKNLTREGVMRAATRLSEAKNPFLLPGIVVKTTPTSRYPVRQVKLERWHNGHWVIFGKLLDARP